MGVWGHEPFENDYARDWLNSQLRGPLAKAFRSKDHHTTLAAAEVVIRLIDVIEDEQLLKLAARATVLAEQDSGWIQSWRDSRQIVQQLEEMRRKLLEELHSRSAPKGWV